MNELASLVCVDDVERVAKARLSRPIVDFFWNGAGEQTTARRNVAAFHDLIIRPRMLRDVSKMDTSIVLLGDQRVTMPIGIAPTAFQRLAHPDGELATARAASKADTVMICSTLATTSIEEIAAATTGILWFQLFVYKDRNSTVQLIKRAEQCGCRALVVTVDAPVLGMRREDARNGFSLPPTLKFANFTQAISGGFAAYVAENMDRSLTWKDIQWMKTITRLPIVIKGILTAEDAVLAAEYGAQAVIVSNHGGRQLDGVPATVISIVPRPDYTIQIEALSEVVHAVGNRLEVYLDGGIRTGTDILKTLGLGARMVFIGRPIVWGLAVAGQAGVEHVLNAILRTELINAMTLTGCTITNLLWTSEESSSENNNNNKNLIVRRRFFDRSHL